MNLSAKAEAWANEFWRWGRATFAPFLYVGLADVALANQRTPCDFDVGISADMKSSQGDGLHIFANPRDAKKYAQKETLIVS